MSATRLRRQGIGTANVAARAVWGLVHTLLFRPTPRPAHAWRRWLLRRFGARVGRGVRVYATARIWAPWNLEMQDESCLGDYVDCYNVDRIVLMRGAIVSQYCFLCTASHDYEAVDLPLVTAPIRIEPDVWLTADVFVAPGITIGEGTVVLARSTVLQDLPAGVVAGGYPARPIRPRRWPAQRTADRTAAAGRLSEPD
ncbi:MAG: putative colanic acid biosynthesis acetyltransferase [Lautropia sp.]